MARRVKEPLTAVLRIPGKAIELNHNQRLNPYVRRERVKRWRLAAAEEAAKLGWPPAHRKVRLDWVIRNGRAIDPAQVHGTAATKAIEDGLVDAGIMPDDNVEWVEWDRIRQEYGPEWKGREEVQVTITVVEEK